MLHFSEIVANIFKFKSPENPYDQLEAVCEQLNFFWPTGYIFKFKSVNPKHVRNNWKQYGSNWKFFRPTGNISSSFRSALVKIKFRYLNWFQYSGSLYLDFETDINTGKVSLRTRDRYQYLKVGITNSIPISILEIWHFDHDINIDTA